MSLNQLLVMLENWARRSENDETVKEITQLWQESPYYFLHHDLLIPTAVMLQDFLDIYESREKFIRLLPDLHYIQDEYIADAIGEDTIKHLLTSTDASDELLLRKVRRLMVAHLEERTTVLNIDKTRRAAAHNEAIALRTSVLRLMEMRKAVDAANSTPTDKPSTNTTDSTGKGYENNQPDSKIFVSPLLY